MTSAGHFVDHYKILQVDPTCDARALETAYHYLAKTFHPDRSDTADITRFTEVVESYKAIREPAERAEYNLIYTGVTGFVFPANNDAYSEEKSAISDAEVHAKILLMLYKWRRANSHNAGVGRYFVQEMLNCSDDIFEFHLWYLKAKGFIETTEQGTLAITIDGVDHVILVSRTIIKETLLISESRGSRDEAQL